MSISQFTAVRNAFPGNMGFQSETFRYRFENEEKNNSISVRRLLFSFKRLRLVDMFVNHVAPYRRLRCSFISDGGF